MDHVATSRVPRIGTPIAMMTLSIVASILAAMLFVWVLYRGEESHLVARELVEQGLINRDALIQNNWPGLTEHTYSPDAAALALSLTVMKPRGWDFTLTVSGVPWLMLLLNTLLTVPGVIAAVKSRTPA